jgi:hypothetical protein
MQSSDSHWSKFCLTTYFFAITLTVLIGPTFAAAQSSSGAMPPTQWSNDLDKYPGLLPEFGRLFDQLQRNVQYPPPRTQSRLLPMLPESTVFYAAFSNYGDASRQALQIFHQELQESPVLRDWWGNTPIPPERARRKTSWRAITSSPNIWEMKS